MLRSKLRVTSGTVKSALKTSQPSFQKMTIEVATGDYWWTQHHLPLCQQHHGCRSFSSPTIWERAKGAWDERSKKSSEKKFRSFINKMSNTDEWTLGDFAEEIDKTANSWMTKVVPGMSNTQEVLAAREASKLAKAAAETMGKEATFADLANMTRVDKLRIAVDAEVSKETVNMMVFQFHSMDVMQTALRQRHLEGKPLPTNEEGLSHILRTEGEANMTPIQRQYLVYVRNKMGAKQERKKVYQATRH